MPQHIQIRKSVFETNSSSSHSLTLTPENLLAMPFSKEVLQAGVLNVAPNDYQWEWYRYYAPTNKIRYLVTQLFPSGIPRGDAVVVTKTCREENDRFDQLCRVVECHTGVSVHLVPGSNGSIDHDSVGVGLSLMGNDDEDLWTFLFTDCYVETSNDNSAAPFVIDTDRGGEFYHEEHFASPAVSAVRVEILFYPYGPRRLTTTTGVDLSLDHPSIVEELGKQGVVSDAVWTCKGSYDPFEHSDVRGQTCNYLMREGLRFSKTLAARSDYVECHTPYAQRVPLEDTQVAQLSIMVPPGLLDKLQAIPVPKAKRAKKVTA